METAVNYYLGEHLLVLVESNEIAFLKENLILHRQKLEPRIMEVLKVLIEGNGEVVPREKFINSIWGNYPGGEEGLIQAISKLRRTFKDSSKAPKIIKTIPKKGYRLLLPVKKTDIKIFNGKSSATLNNQTTAPSATHIIIQQTGILTGFIERLTQPRFLFAFLILSVVVIMILGILSYITFWIVVGFDFI